MDGDNEEEDYEFVFSREDGLMLLKLLEQENLVTILGQMHY
ncbi:hypothetical protein OROGR_009377 [Orobanche gracilis]